MSGPPANLSARLRKLCFIFLFFQRSIGLPDVHSGYGFAIGNMAAFDMNDPEAVVSPGKVTARLLAGVWLLSESGPSYIARGCFFCVHVNLIFCHIFSSTERIDCGHPEAIKISSKAYIN